jgi:P-type conjugative transfer protein TrbJ
MALVAVALLAPAASAPAADIVFDPTNFGANVDQVLHTLEILSRLDQQIRNQYRMLQNWRFTRLDQLLAAMLAIRQTLDQAGALDLSGRYPIGAPAYAARDAEAMEALRRQWLESQRTAVLHTQALQNRTVSEMPGTQARIGEYVRRSNSAPGQTAVLQAGNETLATMTAQVQHLQALEIAQTRIELEEDAHRQAQAAFHRQRRDAMMRDWPPNPNVTHATAAVRSPFDSGETR